VGVAEVSMARSDLIINLVKAGSSGDYVLFKATVEALIADERGKQHHVLADRLSENLRSNGGSLHRIQQEERPHGLFFEVTPGRKLGELILAQEVEQACLELIEEHHRRDLLRSHNLEPRHRVLLAGPPGNGKTSLAEALAESLILPLYVVRYEGVIGSFLGETASRLRKLFDFVRTRQCVLFFDEFDTLGKERGDVHETGEIKRVVSSLLLQIDSLPSHVIVVTATNHPELLDRAVWRRFQLRLFLPPPGEVETTEWFRRLQSRFDVPLGHAPSTLAKKLKGMNYSELEEFALDVQRRYVLGIPNANLKKIVSDRLEQWQARFHGDGIDH
jgi:SpoVK/Ycf46/Vps4 family AAA+-type ATPase